MIKEALNKCLCKQVSALGGIAYRSDMSRFLYFAYFAPLLALRLIEDFLREFNLPMPCQSAQF